MRTLKKSLALVLAVALAVSLLSVGAFASTSGYSDTAKIGATYAEAVDLLTGIGVVSGTTSTTLDPTGNYTREQAAKVLCYISIGKTAADALVTTAAPFKDVAADRWSAGYISYCVSQGIINGNGDGTFSPEAALTGYAWGKMLLVALGKGQDGVYTGSSWQIAVAKDALPLGIYKNDTTAATNKTITRQQAMLLAFNTLFLPTTVANYTWDNGVKHVSGTTSGPSFAASVYSYVSTNNSTGAAANDTLVKVPCTINGSTGYKWYYNDTTTPVTGFYTAETAIGTNTSGKDLATQTSYTTTNSYFTAKITSATAYYSNGASLGMGLIGSTAGAAAAALVGKGTTVKYVDTDNDTTTAEKIYISNYRVDVLKAAPVVKVNPTDGKSYIYIDMATTDIGTSSTYTVLASNVTGYSGLVADDVVTITKNDDGSSTPTYTIAKAATFTGAATGSSATTLVIGGTTYNYGLNADASVTAYKTGTGEGFLNNVAFYTDAYGYLVYAKAVTAATSDYAFILQNGTYSSSNVTSATNQSYVAFKDGTTATITVASVNGAAFSDGSMTTPVINGIYTYSKNTDGTYALTSKTLISSTKYTTTADANGVINQGQSSSSLDTAIATGGTAIKGDANTIYVVRNIKIKGTNAVDLLSTGTTFQAAGTTYYSTWTAYTGYTNMISATKAYYVAVNDTNGYADIVYVTNYASTAQSASSVIYLLGTTPTAVYKDATTIDYYTYPAVVDGVQTVVKAASGTTLATLNLYNGTFAINDGTLCKVVYTDGKLAAGAITPINATSAAGSNGAFVYGTGIAAPSNGLVTIGTGTSAVGYAYTSSTYVFTISADHSTVTMGTADAISTDTAATISAVTNAASVIAGGNNSPTSLQQNTLYAIFIQLAS